MRTCSSPGPRDSRRAALFFSVQTLEGLCHFWLRVNPQGVGDAVDVVEVGDDFDRVQDVAIGKAVLAERLQVLAARGGGRARHKLRKFCQRLLTRGELGATVVVLGMLGELRVPAGLTEILSVRLDSIEAPVRPRDHRGDHFSLGAREPAGPVHRGEI